jgi:hypothetical protein
VVPTPSSKHHAGLLITAKLLNALAVCASRQAVIVDGAWPQLVQFKAHVLAVPRAYPPVPVFDNGTFQRSTRSPRPARRSQKKDAARLVKDLKRKQFRADCVHAT